METLFTCNFLCSCAGLGLSPRRTLACSHVPRIWRTGVLSSALLQIPHVLTKAILYVIRVAYEQIVRRGLPRFSTGRIDPRGQDIDGTEIELSFLQAFVE